MNRDETTKLGRISGWALEISDMLDDLGPLPDCPDCPKCAVYRERLALLEELLGLSVTVAERTRHGLDESLKQTEEAVKQTEEVTLKLDESTAALEALINAVSLAMLREAEWQGRH